MPPPSWNADSHLLDAGPATGLSSTSAGLLGRVLSPATWNWKAAGLGKGAGSNLALPKRVCGIGKSLSITSEDFGRSVRRQLALSWGLGAAAGPAAAVSIPPVTVPTSRREPAGLQRPSRSHRLGTPLSGPRPRSWADGVTHLFPTTEAQGQR